MTDNKETYKAIKRLFYAHTAYIVFFVVSNAMLLR